MRNRRTLIASSVLAGVLAFVGLAPAAWAQERQGDRPTRISHVLLISVDGLHAVDLANYVKTHPGSTLSQLSGTGVTYPNAATSQPSDSFPGLLSEVTGGTPRSTGVYYDNSYDRSLVAPVVLAGSPTGVTCTPGSPSNPRGTNVLYDESVDVNLDRIDGGGGINPQALPRDPVTCQPVYPHSYLRVNTIFEVAKAAGLRTAWSDKHLAYDLVNGPSGAGVDDLYTPEIAASKNVDGTCLYPDCGTGTDNVTDTIQYDNFKVTAILNEIDGKDHTGATTVGVPAIFGMNFQAVSVGQKSPNGGYAPDPTVVGGFAPTGDLAQALDFVDGALGRMVSELQNRGLRQSTLVIVTAKHGQAPIDRSLLRKLGHAVPDVLQSAGITPTQVTDDDVALVWLNRHEQTAAAVRALATSASTIGISSTSQIRFGASIVAQFGSPLRDPRVPDIVVTPNVGVIYTKASKIAEHGGFSRDDTSVALLVSNPGLKAGTASEAVQTTQIAPTILKALGLKPRALQAVQLEHTHVLPGLKRLHGGGQGENGDAGE